MESEKTNTDVEFERLRLVASYWAIGSICAVGAFSFIFFIYMIIKYDRVEKLLDLALSQPAALMATPACAATSLVIVLILRSTSGPVEFSAFTFSFKGASGPIIFWNFCTIVLIWGVGYLWK